jgi:protein-tyrosine-phosphatase
MLSQRKPTKNSILFVCRGNTCRSPLAKVILQDLKKGCRIDSCGVSVIESKASHNAQIVALKNGLVLSNHQPRQVEPSDFYEFDRMYALDDFVLSELKSRQPPDSCNSIQLLGQKPIMDPYNQSIQVYQQTFQVIHDRLVIEFFQD